MRIGTGKICISVLLTLFLILSVFSQGYCSDTENIVRWVASQLRVGNNYAMPQIHFIGKTELGRLFAAGSDGLMTRWAAEQSSADAEQLMNLYMNSVVGLYEPKTRIIYVGNFLSPCRQKAIVAHEVTHYFQNVMRGPIRGEGMAAEMLLMQREMEASIIETKYEEAHCGDPLLMTNRHSNIYYP